MLLLMGWILTDRKKRRQLMAAAKALGYSDGGNRVLVTPRQFFDGNYDAASIGCNLPKHPGIAAFSRAFRKIEKMDGVAEVYFAITEIDETYDSIWPFTDTALIVTRLAPAVLQPLLKKLEPYEIGLSEEVFVNPPAIPEGYQSVCVCWD
jgi:hypothetical protein